MKGQCPITYTRSYIDLRGRGGDSCGCRLVYPFDRLDPYSREGVAKVRPYEWIDLHAVTIEGRNMGRDAQIGGSRKGEQTTNGDSQGLSDMRSRSEVGISINVEPDKHRM